MFGIASAFGDFQGLINTTLENDSLSREQRKNTKWKGFVDDFYLAINQLCIILHADKTHRREIVGHYEENYWLA